MPIISSSQSPDSLDIIYPGYDIFIHDLSDDQATKSKEAVEPNYIRDISYNIDIPTDMLGFQPQDIYYLQSSNNYYIYGGRKLVILNGETHEVVESFEVSDYGSFTPRLPTINHSCFAYDADNEWLFCAQNI